MADPQRPAFYEGQVLAAADLGATVDHARARAARHDRYLHDWGIAEGLALSAEPRTDPGGAEGSFTVTVQAGLAVDGTGREVLVRAPVPLQEAVFQEVNGDPDAPGPYPVFLAGLDRDPVPASIVPDACGANGQRSRVDESYQILFGRLGDERLVAEQRAPAVADGPGDGREPWLVLLGYVTWENGQFTGVAPDVGGVVPRYAGVRADTVAARSGSLTLRTRPEAAEGEPAVTLDGPTGLAFGIHKADGSVDSLMVVSPRGDLTVRGTITGGQQGGAVTAVSGVATDGMILPLPAGVSEEQVADGQVVLHVSLKPHRYAPAAQDGIWLTSPTECTVDSQRRVRCRMRSVQVGAAPPEWHDRPAAADFLVLATVALEQEGGTS